MPAISHASRRGRMLLATLAAVCAIVALAIGGAATASAAGPDYLNFGDSVRYPTWGWGGKTRVCAYNYEGQWGHVYVDPVYGDSVPDQFWVRPYSTDCIERSWWGNPVDVVNNGATFLRVWSS